MNIYYCIGGFLIYILLICIFFGVCSGTFGAPNGPEE